jgi:hypothetical protein
VQVAGSSRKSRENLRSPMTNHRRVGNLSKPHLFGFGRILTERAFRQRVRFGNECASLRQFEVNRSTSRKN